MTQNTNHNLITSLNKALSNHFALYIKTQNYHWNIQGPAFLNLHELFETQYTEISSFIDATAEHIRSLNSKVPASFEIFNKNCEILPGNESFTASEMIKDLIQSHETMEKVLKEALQETETASDHVINDYLIGCLTFHRKALWFLKSSL
ncbi:MAG: DNA starvation/stationary phase protection protein [Candidatus Paracaedibacteraceae bacterium]|nr:DNA starvation/stationary phase protection protein [Candidatus Paracaedibacteraceae bacterium]